MLKKRFILPTIALLFTAKAFYLGSLDKEQAHYKHPLISYSATTLSPPTISSSDELFDSFTATVRGDTFSEKSLVLGEHYTVIDGSLPEGLELEVLSEAKGTEATVRLAGSSTDPKAYGDVNVTISFLGSAFSSGMAPNDGSEDHTFTISRDLSAPVRHARKPQKSSELVQPL